MYQFNWKLRKGIVKNFMITFKFHWSSSNFFNMVQEIYEGQTISKVQLLNDHSTEAVLICTLSFTGTEVIHLIFNFLTASSKIRMALKYFIYDIIHSYFLYVCLETAVLCDWVWRAGVHTGFRTITLVLYIRSLPNLATWFPCWRGRTLFILRSLGQRSRSLTINIIFDSRIVSTW
jgi:hypothetical protein